MPKFPVRRDELPEGDCLCNHCTALCCRYFSLPIDAPKTWDDYDNLRWYLSHGRVSLFVEEGTWYLVVYGACQYLTPNNMCGIYHDRPLICSQYTTDGCEYDNDFVFEKFFETPDQIQEYAEAILPPRESASSRRPERRQSNQREVSKYFSHPIDAPETWDDYDNLRWYLTHGPVALFVNEGKWHLAVYGNSGHLTPAIHRDENHSLFEKFFETPEQIWEYAGATLPPREPLERDKPQSITLPIVNAV